MIDHISQVITNISGADFAIVSTITVGLWKGTRWCWQRFKTPKEYEEHKCWVCEDDGTTYKSKVRYHATGRVTVRSQFGSWKMANSDGTFMHESYMSRWWTSKPPVAKGSV